MPCPLKDTSSPQRAAMGIMKRKVEPDSPQSISLLTTRRMPPSTLKAVLPGYFEVTLVILVPRASKARQVASMSADMLMLSTIDVPYAKAAQIISLCPILLEEGIQTLPARGVGFIRIVSIAYSYLI